MVCLLRDFDAAAASGGPLSEESGVFWVDLREPALAEAQRLFPRLGYTSAIDLPLVTRGAALRHTRRVRWRKRNYELHRLYEEREDDYRSQAPDRSEFLFVDADGTTRLIRGYRGNDRPGSRRGLSVCDARLLVNLVSPPGGQGRLIDPFAGAGGIVRHALAAGFETYSSDVDPALSPGLTHLGSEHRVADARELPFPTEFFDAIATEPPYDHAQGSAATRSVAELARVLKPGGRTSMLCATWQAREVLPAAEELGLRILLCSPIDRKGLACTVIVWEKPVRPPRTTYPQIDLIR